MEPLTLFSFVERVARLRFAQRAFDDIQSNYNRNQVVPLALEVDALCIVILGGWVSVEFKSFTELVHEMRKAQHELLKVRSRVADAHCLQLESDVDKAVAGYVTEVIALNALLASWNCYIEGPVMPNNRQKKGGRP